MEKPKETINFSDLRKLPRGVDNIPSEVNAIVRTIIHQAFLNDILTTSEENNALLDLKEIEIKKWFGTGKLKKINFTFRYGICQSYLCLDKKMRIFGFDLNDVNHAVNFSKDKTK